MVLASGTPLLLSYYLPGSETIRTIVLSAPPQASRATPPAAPSQTALPAPQETQTLKTEDVAALIDVWRSVWEQMNSIIESTNQVEALLSAWPKRTSEDRPNLLNQLVILRDTVNQRRVSVATLATFYERYPNIRAVIRDRDSEAVFSRLYRALDTFATEIRSLPQQLPENFENTLRPYAGEVKLAGTALAKWASDTRTYSESQSKELNSATR